MKPAWADEVWTPFNLSIFDHYPYYCSGTAYIKPRIIAVSYGLDPFSLPGECESMILKMLSFIRKRYRNQFVLPIHQVDKAYCFFREHARSVIPNLWLGVHISNQEEADWRIPYLANIEACGKRVIFCDPLTRPVTLQKYIRYIDWVIVKGETGYYSCPLHPEWARSLREECRIAGVPFFFEGWGDWLPEDQEGVYRRIWKYRRNLAVDLEHGGFVPPNLRKRGKDIYVARVGPIKAGRKLDGEEWLQYPEIIPRKPKKKKRRKLPRSKAWWTSWKRPLGSVPGKAGSAPRWGVVWGAP